MAEQETIAEEIVNAIDEQEKKDAATKAQAEFDENAKSIMIMDSVQRCIEYFPDIVSVHEEYFIDLLRKNQSHNNVSVVNITARIQKALDEAKETPTISKLMKMVGVYMSIAEHGCSFVGVFDGINKISELVKSQILFSQKFKTDYEELRAVDLKIFKDLCTLLCVCEKFAGENDLFFTGMQDACICGTCESSKEIREKANEKKKKESKPKRQTEEGESSTKPKKQKKIV